MKNFRLSIKRHPYYLYISIFLIALYFFGNSIISNKITSRTESLSEFVIQINIRTKYNTFKFDFTKLSSYIANAEKVAFSSNNLDESKLKEKLKFIIELAALEKNIDNGFMFFIHEGNVVNSYFTNTETLEYEQNIINNNYSKQNQIIDTIIKFDENIYNRKILTHQLNSATTLVVGYDINLLKYWQYFSQNQSGDGSYSVLTNNKGVCILHPNIEYIGKNVDTFFKQTSLKKVIQNTDSQSDVDVMPSELIKTNVTSEYLSLDVVRYFKVINTGKDDLILMVNFPIDISVKESITNVKQYFLWLSILALCTFMLLLGIARLQLRKEFSEKLKSEKEKEKLAISNEKIKQENTTLQLNQLKKKMNPHFLFNSLNSLLVLIDVNTELSQKFVLKLAEVYRYLLEGKNGNLISVKEELDFLQQYFFLQEIRFKDSLRLNITHNCNDKCLSKKIPFLALETLVENAIKHNEATKQKPLIIEVIINSNFIMVINNYNPRKKKEKDSYHIGLNYLKNSYQYYNISSFKAEVFDEKFKCILPLLR